MNKIDLTTILQQLNAQDAQAIKTYLDEVKNKKYEIKMEVNKLTLSYFNKKLSQKCSVIITAHFSGGDESTFEFITNNVIFKTSAAAPCK